MRTPMRKVYTIHSNRPQEKATDGRLTQERDGQYPSGTDGLNLNKGDILLVDDGVDGAVANYRMVDRLDNSGNAYHGTVSGNVTFGTDSVGNYMLVNGNKDHTAGTGTVANLVIGNVMNFTQATDFSYYFKVKIDTLVPNNIGGIFGSQADACMHMEGSSGIMRVKLRGSSDISYDIGTNYRATRLGQTHSFGFTYIASTGKFYVYLDGVLQNTGGTSGPATFLTNNRYIGDSAIGGGNPSSCKKTYYQAKVFNKALTDAEHLLLATNSLAYLQHSILPTDNSGILAYYPMVGNANDTVAGGVFGNGTVSGAVLDTDRRGLPGSYKFDGVDDFIELNDGTPGSTYTNGFSISAWIKPATVGELNGRIIDKSTTTATTNGFSLYVSTINKVTLRINGGSEIFTANNTIIFGNGNWYHVVATVSTGGLITLYVNGTQSGTPGTSGAISGITTTNKTRIGNRSGATDRTFDGLIDDVMIFNRPLTASEVTAIYNGYDTPKGNQLYDNL